MRCAGVLLGTQKFVPSVNKRLSSPPSNSLRKDAPFMTPGTHTTPSSFFEEEEAANMPFSADTMDGGVPGYGCVDGGRY